MAVLTGSLGYEKIEYGAMKYGLNAVSGKHTVTETEAVGDVILLSPIPQLLQIEPVALVAENTATTFAVSAVIGLYDGTSFTEVVDFGTASGVKALKGPVSIEGNGEPYLALKVTTAAAVGEGGSTVNVALFWVAGSLGGS